MYTVNTCPNCHYAPGQLPKGKHRPPTNKPVDALTYDDWLALSPWLSGHPRTAQMGSE